MANLEGALGGAGAGAGIGGAIGGPKGAIIGGAVGGAAGLFMPKSGGVNTKSIGKTISEYLSQVRAAGAATKADVARYGKNTEKKVARYGNELIDASDNETAAFWNNLGIFNEELINTASALVESYNGDVVKALETLETNVNKLNESYATDMGAEIDRYATAGEAINAKLAADKDLVETKFLDRVNQFNREYQEQTFQEADAAKQEVFGEDDKFLTKAGELDQSFRAEGALSEQTFKDEEAANLARRDAEARAAEDTFRRESLAEADSLEGKTAGFGDTFLNQMAGSVAGSKAETAGLFDWLSGGTAKVDSEAEAARSLQFNTANAAAFGNLADTLSKAAQQTRMDLLANADPRALELSAIADNNAAAMMSGQISADVQANLARSSAMQALSGGFGAGSEMGRGLSARDLGLTSMDLMQQGTQMYDAQRRLNYDTRVAGTQVDPFAVMQQSGLSSEQALRTATSNADMVNRDRMAAADIMGRNINARMDTERLGFTTNLDNLRSGAIAASGMRSDAFTNVFNNQRQNIADAFAQGNQGAFQRYSGRGQDSRFSYSNMLGAAESSRNTRIGAINEASGQRMQTFDRLFGSNRGAADDLRVQDMTAAAQMADNRRDDNIRYSGMRIGATQDIYNNNLGFVDTVFNTGLGLAGQNLSTGLSVAGDMYKTNTVGAGATYDARMGVYGNIFNAKTNTANNVLNAKTSAAIAALNAETAALGGAAATNANLPVIEAAARQGNAMQSAQIWGAALSSASSLAGSYRGSQNWSNVGSRSFGGYTGYTNNPATGNMVGYAAPTSYRPPGATSWVNT
jgi:gas vesicle protein